MAQESLSQSSGKELQEKWDELCRAVSQSSDNIICLPVKAQEQVYHGTKVRLVSGSSHCY